MSLDAYTSDVEGLLTDTNINFVFESKCTIVQYLELLSKSMEKINLFNPDALLIDSILPAIFSL